MLAPAPWPPGVLGSPLISLLFWILICFSIAALFTKRYSVRPLIVALILRSIYYLGIGPTLSILGALNVSAGGTPPHPRSRRRRTSRRRGRLPAAAALSYPACPCDGIKLVRDPRLGLFCASSPPWTTWGSRHSERASQESLGAPASGLLCARC